MNACWYAFMKLYVKLRMVWVCSGWMYEYFTNKYIVTIKRNFVDYGHFDNKNSYFTLASETL